MKKNKLPSLISILILTLITAVLWVSLSTYRAFTVKPSESVPEEISKPITPSLDQITINKIESEIFFDGYQIPDNFVVVPSSAPINQPVQETVLTPSPLATPSAEETLTPVPSPTPSI
jgi:hypothetical protein